MRNTHSSMKTGKLDSELLRTFLTVAESGSFSLAATRIFRSQSAVSLQIKQLENLLSQAVFERHARGVSLTPVGEKLRSTAEKVVGLLDESIGELRANPLQGPIRLGIPDEYGYRFLPGVIAQFARNHPLIELSVTCGCSASFPQALEDNEIDLAVHAVESPSAEMTLLRNEKIGWVTSKHHQAHLQDPLPLALFDRACWWRDRALDALNDAGKSYRVVFSSESVTGINAAVAAGVAIAVVGESSMRDNFRVLSSADGFPALPASALVLEQGAGFDAGVAEAMSHVICEAFGKR